MKRSLRRKSSLGRLAFAACAAIAQFANAGAVAIPVQARFVDSAPVDEAQFDADTILAPSNLALTSPIVGTSALSWTASESAYAVNTIVLRGTATGGPYSVIATLPATATSYSDTPGTGAFFYVVRSSANNWISADSNEVNTVYSALATSWFNCTGQAAQTGGDNNGYEISSAAGCGDDGVVAQDSMSGTNTRTACGNNSKDRHRFTGFGITGVPVGATVRGFEVRTQSSVDVVGGTIKVCVRVSNNNGSTWSSYTSLSLSSTTEKTLLFGSTSNLWTRTWTLASLNNVAIEVVNVSSSLSKTFSLDTVQVRATYST